MNCKTVQFTRHAVQRMFQRAITTENVRRVLESGEVIASYPDDTPYPSVLMLGYVQDRPLHVVAGRNPANEECIVVTVYIPDPVLWNEDFKTRRR
ncbi:MAG: DUF4258 domain-containing protein [Leptospirales bacterium]